MNKEQRKRLRPFISALKDAAESISNAKSEIEGIRDEEQEKLDNMPEGLRAGERGEMLESMVEALTTIADFDIDSLIEACDNVEAEL